MLWTVQLGLPLEPAPPEPPRPPTIDVPARADAVGRAERLPRPEPPERLTFVFVKHKRARRYLLRVDSEGRIRVTIPRGGSKREAEAFALRHQGWILRQRAAVAQPMFSSEQRLMLHARARVELPRRLLDLAASLQLHVARVTVRNQRTRWGSCGRDGHISLNWRLVLMPEWVRDYVLIHELMHLRRMDHSPTYWRLVAAAYPQYAQARAWLRTHGARLR